jgi:hypothetical protein
MATTIATLAAKLVLDNKAFLAGFKQSQAAAKGFSSSVGGGISSALGSAVTGFGAAVAGAISLGTAVHSLQQSMERVDRGAKLADRLGLSNEAMQRMAIVAKAGNVDVELLAKSMLKMGRNIGTGGKSLDERFFDVADAISQIKDPAERSAKAVAIFGKGGDQLSDILLGGSRKLREASELIDRFGLSISRVDAAKVEAANDAWGRMGIVISGITDKIAVGLSPALEDFATQSIRLIDNLNVALERLGTNFEGVGNAIGFALGVLVESPLARQFNKLFPSDKKPGGPSSASPASSPFSFGGGDTAKKFKLTRPGALERGSMEAVRALQNTQGADPITALHQDAQKQIRLLEAIRDFIDPMKRPDAPRLAEGAL